MRLVVSRILVVGLVGLGSIVGCSSNTNTQSFCDQAWDYLQFQARIGDVVADPAEMESFMENWQVRLNDLSDAAPDQALTELSIMRAGVADLDQDLAGVGYDLFALPVDGLMSPDADEASARFDLILDDECQINPDGASVLVPAPDPLDDPEFDELIEPDLGPVTVEEELQADLRDQLGLSQQESDCFTSKINLDQLEQLVSNDVDEETGAVIVAALESCGITLD